MKEREHEQPEAGLPQRQGQRLAGGGWRGTSLQEDGVRALHPLVALAGLEGEPASSKEDGALSGTDTLALQERLTGKPRWKGCLFAQMWLKQQPAANSRTSMSPRFLPPALHRPQNQGCVRDPQTSVNAQLQDKSPCGKLLPRGALALPPPRHTGRSSLE